MIIVLIPIITPKMLHSTGYILIFGCWAFNLIKSELIFVWSATDTSFIHHALINWLFASLMVMAAIMHHLSRIAKLIKIAILMMIIQSLRLTTFPSSWSWLDLGVVASCLWSSFNLILNLCGLFFIWITNLYTLTNLLVMRSI